MKPKQRNLPSGKLIFYGKSPFQIGRSSKVMGHSHPLSLANCITLPEGGPHLLPGQFWRAVASQPSQGRAKKIGDVVNFPFFCLR